MKDADIIVKRFLTYWPFTIVLPLLVALMVIWLLARASVPTAEQKKTLALLDAPAPTGEPNGYDYLYFAANPEIKSQDFKRQYEFLNNNKIELKPTIDISEIPRCKKNEDCIDLTKQNKLLTRKSYKKYKKIYDNTLAALDSPYYYTRYFNFYDASFNKNFYLPATINTMRAYEFLHEYKINTISNTCHDLNNFNKHALGKDSLITSLTAQAAFKGHMQLLISMLNASSIDKLPTSCTQLEDSLAYNKNDFCDLMRGEYVDHMHRINHLKENKEENLGYWRYVFNPDTQLVYTGLDMAYYCQPSVRSSMRSDDTEDIDRHIEVISSSHEKISHPIHYLITEPQYNRYALRYMDHYVWQRLLRAYLFSYGKNYENADVAYKNLPASLKYGNRAMHISDDKKEFEIHLYEPSDDTDHYARIPIHLK